MRIEVIESMRHSKAIPGASGLKLICAGTAAAVVLRSIQMLFFFDFDTGFYPDGGLAAWISLLLPLAAVIAAVAAARPDCQSLGPWHSCKRPVLAALAALSGAVLCGVSLVMAADYKFYLDSGFSQFESIRQQGDHVLYIIASLLFGVVQLAGAMGLFSGRDILPRAPLIYIPAVLWGLANLVMVYVFYAKSSSVVENIFALIGAAALLLALLYLCRLFAGLTPQKTALRLLSTGGLAAVLVIGGQGVNLVLRLSGKSYAGEIPPACQLAEVGTALFVLGAMVSYVGRNGEEAEPPYEA